jgi:hypothetical protein
LVRLELSVGVVVITDSSYDVAEFMPMRYKTIGSLHPVTILYFTNYYARSGVLPLDFPIHDNPNTP